MKNQLFLVIFSFLVLSLIATPSMGQLPIDTASGFQSKIEKAQAACENLSCPGSLIKIKSLNHEEISRLGRNVLSALHQYSQQLANDIWPDTILEGPYENHEKVQLDQVQIVLENETIIGYRITYSDKAWDIDTCQLDNSNHDLNTCESGRIIESAFISFNLDEFFRDEFAYAQFISDSDSANILK